jgi:hypothetical protein
MRRLPRGPGRRRRRRPARSGRCALPPVHSYSRPPPFLPTHCGRGGAARSSLRCGAVRSGEPLLPCRIRGCRPALGTAMPRGRPAALRPPGPLRRTRARTSAGGGGDGADGADGGAARPKGWGVGAGGGVGGGGGAGRNLGGRGEGGVGGEKRGRGVSDRGGAMAGMGGGSTGPRWTLHARWRRGGGGGQRGNVPRACPARRRRRRARRGAAACAERAARGTVLAPSPASPCPSFTAHGS